MILIPRIAAISMLPVYLAKFSGFQIFGQWVKLRLPGIEHGYGKIIEVPDVPSR